MTNKVRLKASGYTWKCPECGRDNYTGQAPEEVFCEGCKGVFCVSGLSHRRKRKSVETVALSDNGGVGVKESFHSGIQSSLFPPQADDLDFNEGDDIPF